MADNTKIEWADATVNYVNGCSVISAGCTNCYAMRLAGTRMKHHPSRAGLTRDTKAGPVWTGEVRANETALLQPLAWKRPRRIFWNAHGDLFHESVRDAWIDRQFAVMALTPQHTHMVLTKRPERMRAYVSALVDTFHASPDSMDERFGELCVELTMSPCAAGAFEEVDWPLPNVWLGTSVEDQRAADERIPHLLATPAAARFLSCEPLLGPLDLAGMLPTGGGNGVFRAHDPAAAAKLDAENIGFGWAASDLWLAHIHWVIAGGESGPGARPMHPDWARSLRDQCAAAGVAFHFKQWGEWGRIADQRPPVDHLPEDADQLTRVGKARAGRLLDGRTHDEFPGVVMVGETGPQPRRVTGKIIAESEVPY